MTTGYVLNNTVSVNDVFCQQLRQEPPHLCHVYPQDSHHLHRRASLSANTHSQLSFRPLEKDTTFSPSLAVGGAAVSRALPPPSSLLTRAAECWSSMHMCDHSQQMCLNGEKLEPMSSGYLSSHRPVPPVAMVTASSHPVMALVLHNSSESSHCPLYGCQCVKCLELFSSPKHGYLTPLSHFNGDENGGPCDLSCASSLSYCKLQLLATVVSELS